MVITSRKLTIPSYMKSLGDYVEGESVFLVEENELVEFIVAKHDYQSDQNGTGKTLLVRKDCYAEVSWVPYTHGNGFIGSNLFKYANEIYLPKLAVNRLVNQTNISHAVFDENENMTIMFGTAKVFVLSLTEVGIVGFSNNALDDEPNDVLPIASDLKIAYFSGTKVSWWTRSQRYNEDQVCFCDVDTDRVASLSPVDRYHYFRPCFTLPETCQFHSSTNTFAGRLMI